jgi:hypothetical protein
MGTLCLLLLCLPTAVSTAATESDPRIFAPRTPPACAATLDHYCGDEHNPDLKVAAVNGGGVIQNFRCRLVYFRCTHVHVVILH